MYKQPEGRTAGMGAGRESLTRITKRSWTLGGNRKGMKTETRPG